MKAQVIYDFANEGGCSGNDMHNFFRQIFNGEPSPSGYKVVPTKEGKQFMKNSLDVQAHNSPSLIEWCQDMAKKYNIQ